MNKDIRLHTDFIHSRKRKKLQQELGCDGVVSLIDLWLISAIETPDGDLTGVTSSDIEIDANWYGKGGAFVECLIRLGFLDKTKTGFQLHNWIIRQPWAAGAEKRSNKSRFNRLAGINKAVFEVLGAMGFTEINKADYLKIYEIGKIERMKKKPLSGTNIEKQIKRVLNIKSSKSGNNGEGNQIVDDRSSDAQRLLDDRSSDAQEPLDDCLTIRPSPGPGPGPGPVPSPVPVPSPAPNGLKILQQCNSYSVDTLVENFCPGCFTPLGDGSICPNCQRENNDD